MLSFVQNRKSSWIEIIKIAWPLVVANSFWNIQLTIDRVFLGAHSTEALAAAMTVMAVFWTPMALLQQTSGYVTTFVAQYYGAKDYKMLGPSLWQAIYLSLMGGILFLGLIFVSGWFFGSLGHSEAVTLLEIEYFDSIAYSALPMALVAAFSGFFSGRGDTKSVMWINGVGLLFNAVFDYLFIFGKAGIPAMGIAGAGYATTLASWASAFYGLYLILKQEDSEKFHLENSWRWNPSMMKRFIRFGLPSGMQWALEGLAFTMFLIMIGRFPNGDAALASSSIAVTVMMLSVMPCLGVAQAVMILVGQHLGEKKPDLAEKASWSGLQVCIGYMAIMALSFILFPEFYLGWFQNDQNPELWREVSFLVPYLLMFIATFTSFDSMNLVFSFTLKGAGDTRFVSLVALSLPWPLMVIPSYLMSGWEGAIFWAWGAATIYGIVQSLVFLGRFRGGKWKTMSVMHG